MSSSAAPSGDRAARESKGRALTEDRRNVNLEGNDASPSASGGMLSLLNNPTLIHISAEILLFGGLVFWFNRKMSSMREEIDSQKKMMSQMQQAVIKHEQLLAMILGKKPIPPPNQTPQPHRSPPPQQASPRANEEIQEEDNSEDLDNILEEEMKSLEENPQEEESQPEEEPVREATKPSKKALKKKR